MSDINALSLPRLIGHLLPDDHLDRLCRLWLEEDLGDVGDITSNSLIEPQQEETAVLAAREPGVAAGLAVALRLIDREAFSGLCIDIHIDDGRTFEAGDALATMQGPLLQMLAIERLMLNLLGRLCGIATLTSRYVAEVMGTDVLICDTRKTTPGLRVLEKYAVRCGGGTLHRLGLHDALLYKDNHLAGIAEPQLAAVLTRAIESARAAHEIAFVEVEVDRISQLRALAAMPQGMIDFILLDNMSLVELRDAAEIRDAVAPHLLLEASGGVTLQTLREIADTGVDRVSVGGLTHAAASLDIGLDIAARQPVSR